VSKKKLTQKERKLVKNIARGMPQAEAAIEAGYSEKNPSQSAYQAMQTIARRMPEVMEKLGLTDEALIERHLLPLLDATETKFFSFRRQTTKKRKKILEQVIEERQVEALGTRAVALDMAFKLKGSYAPKQIDFDPDDPIPVTVIDVSDIPKHG
jgi:phage terminase small subunit